MMTTNFNNLGKILGEKVKEFGEEEITRINNKIVEVISSPGYPMVGDIKQLENSDGTMSVSFMAKSDGKQNIAGLVMRGGAYKDEETGKFTQVKPVNSLNAFEK